MTAGYDKLKAEGKLPKPVEASAPKKKKKKKKEAPVEEIVEEVAVDSESVE